MSKSFRPSVAILASILLLPSFADSAGAANKSGHANKMHVARTALVRPPAPPDDDARGVLEIRRKKDRHWFAVKAKRLSAEGPFDPYQLFVEEPANSGLMVDAGNLMHIDGGVYRLKGSSQQASLPLGVLDVGLLSGRRVEVRDGASEVVLRGLVGDISIKPKKLQEKAGMHGSEGVGVIRVKHQPMTPNDRLEVTVKGLKPDTTYNVLMGDTGEKLGFVGKFDSDHKGRGTFRVQTRTGEPLPLGVDRIEQLITKEIEVCEAATGATLLLGNVPVL